MNGFSGRAFKPLIANGDVNSAFRQALWSDALYVRDWMHLADLSEAKLRIRLLAHDVVRSYDLAHLVLLALDGKREQPAADYCVGWWKHPAKPVTCQAPPSQISLGVIFEHILEMPDRATSS